MSDAPFCPLCGAEMFGPKGSFEGPLACGQDPNCPNNSRFRKEATQEGRSSFFSKTEQRERAERKWEQTGVQGGPTNDG